MTCDACTHSAWSPAGGRWCGLHRTVAVRLCGDFTYEPGAAG